MTEYADVYAKISYIGANIEGPQRRKWRLDLKVEIFKYRSEILLNYIFTTREIESKGIRLLNIK